MNKHIEGTLYVHAPTTDFTVGLVFGGFSDNAGADDVFGRFENPPAAGSWCKLTGLYTGNGHFSSIGKDGRFQFVDVPSETYILVCWNGLVVYDPSTDVTTMPTTLVAQLIDAAAGSNAEIVIPAPPTASKRSN